MLRRTGLMMLLALASNCLFAAELQRIVLQDGSSVNAEVLSLNNGVYTLRSPTLGKVTVSAGQVHTIQSIRATSALPTLEPSPAVPSASSMGRLMGQMSMSERKFLD